MNTRLEAWNRAFRVIVAAASLAGAGTIAPNPGGSTVITNSTTATIQYVDTPVTTRVDGYSTTIIGFLNGTSIFSQTFSAPFSDSSVRAAIAVANAILAADNATYGAPKLDSTFTSLLSSVTAPPPTYTCLALSALTTGNLPQGSTVVATTTAADSFGPATVMVGDCQSDSFTILPGQLNINVNTLLAYTIPRSIVTTDTYMTAQVYEVDGTTGAVTTPEPATWGLVLAGAGLLVFWRARRRVST